MATGMREILFNTQERAISSDLNRLQRFKGQDIGELFRYMLDAYANDDLEAGAVATVPGPGEAPGRAEVINGLLFRPQVGTQFGSVDAGVIFALANDGDSDASPYKFIRYDGDGGLLNIAAGGGGATRIDVIEFTVATSQKTVTESRDVFNPSTGLFTATSLVKEQRGWIQFRVRSGSAGGGFPGVVAGWTPIAIASVPQTALTNDDVTFWDVRPMLSDREFQPFALASETPVGPRINGKVRPSVAAANQGGTLTGHCEARINGRRLGGRIRWTAPGTDADSVNLNSSSVYEAGISYGSAFLYYVYLLTPFGLPRWARYSDATTGRRVPRSPRGIIVMSTKGPADMAGRPSAGIVLPAAYGLGNTPITDGVCLFMGKVDDSGSGITTLSQYFGGHQQLLGEFNSIANTSPTSVSGTIAKWTLTPGVHFPRNARRIHLEVAYQATIAANSNGNSAGNLFVWDGSSVGANHQEWVTMPVGANLSNATGGSANREVRATASLPIPNAYPNAVQAFEIWLQTGGSAINGTPVIYVLGWDVGP